MNERTKQFLLFGGLIITVILIILGIYFVFFRAFTGTTNTDNANQPSNQSANTNGIDFPTINSVTNGSTNTSNLNTNQLAVNTNTTSPTNATGIDTTIANGGPTTVVRLTTNYTQDPTTDANGSGLLYYDRTRQLFIHQDAAGAESLLSPDTFPEISRTIWSPRKTAAILEFPDGSNVYYDFVARRQVTLPRELSEIVFAPDGTKIAYKFLGDDADMRWLAVAAPDGSNQQIIEFLGDRQDDVVVTWSPSGTIIAWFSQDLPDGSEIFPVGQFGENYPSFNVPGIGFAGSWLGDGTRLVYNLVTSANDYRPSLWLTTVEGDRVGRTQQSLSLATWVDKCTMPASTTAYCAVPTALPTGAGLYRELAAGVPDSLWQVDVASGRASKLADPYTVEGERKLTASSLSLSADGRYLYFLDDNTHRLFRLTLTP